MAEHREHPHLLLWYVSGDLEPDQVRETEAHLARCRACATEVSALSSMLETLRRDYPGVAARIPPPPPRGEGAAPRASGATGSPWARRGVRASIVAAAGLAVLAIPLLAGRWAAGPPAPSIREVRTVAFSPALRGPGDENVLEGPGPWAVTVNLPFGAPEGRYEVRVEAVGWNAALPAPATLDSDGSGRLSVVVPSVPGKGRYRLVVRPLDAPDAPEWIYSFTADGEP